MPVNFYVRITQCVIGNSSLSSGFPFCGGEGSGKFRLMMCQGEGSEGQGRAGGGGRRGSRGCVVGQEMSRLERGSGGMQELAERVNQVKWASHFYPRTKELCGGLTHFPNKMALSFYSLPGDSWHVSFCLNKLFGLIRQVGLIRDSCLGPCALSPWKALGGGWGRREGGRRGR